MARIRTIKPEFFRHEGLQDLEIQYPGKYPMLVYPGLWTLCDANGIFQWKPRQIKLDVLPFLNFDMEETLGILVQGGFIVRYSVDGKEYGMITTFREHQRLSGKEAGEAGEKYPKPPLKNTKEAFEQRAGSIGEATGKQSESTQKNDDFRDAVQETIDPDHIGLIENPVDDDQFLNHIDIVDLSSCEAMGKHRGSVRERPVVQEKEREKEKEKELKAFCPEPEKSGTGPDAIEVVLEIPIIGNGQKAYPVTKSMIAEWQETYPGIDVEQTVKECRQWNIANPTRRKTKSGIARHIVSWLQREQNRGGGRKQYVADTRTYEELTSWRKSNEL